MKANVISDFKALPRALAEAASTANKAGFELHEGDTLVSCIWRVLSDKRERTANEIALVLQQTEWEFSEVNTTLRRLANEGYLEVMMAGNKKFNTFKIKKGMEMPEGSISKEVRKFEVKDAFVPDAKGIINPAEGLDVCLWKVTSDRKARFVDEIGDLLAVYGFNRGTVKDRVIYFAHKGWYERIGKAKQTRYTMKKHIQMPTPPVLIAADLVEKGSSAGTYHERPEPEVKKVEAVSSHTHTFCKEDGPHINIWKAMSDYREYTAAEVGLLLSEVGFNPATIGVHMSSLFTKRKWFDRKHIEGSKAYVYTLRRDVPMPDPLPHPEVKEQPQLELATDTSEETEPETEQKEEPMQTTPVAAAPLVEINVKLKGIELSFSEADTLARDLREGGFDKADSKDMFASPLLDVSIRIKGLEFSKTELKTVTAKLLESGFGR